jgi:hypothetical protein
LTSLDYCNPITKLEKSKITHQAVAHVHHRPC